MHYAGARYYMPNIGRWTSVDPLAAKYPGYSPYNYVLNNPLRLVDPDGRAPQSCCQTASQRAFELGQSISDGMARFFGGTPDQVRQAERERTRVVHAGAIDFVTNGQLVADRTSDHAVTASVTFGAAAIVVPERSVKAVAATGSGVMASTALAAEGAGVAMAGAEALLTSGAPDAVSNFRDRTVRMTIGVVAGFFGVRTLIRNGTPRSGTSSPAMSGAEEVTAAAAGAAAVTIYDEFDN